MFRPNGGVIQPGADAVGGLNLAEFILQNVTARALQHTERAALKPRRVLLGPDAESAGFRATRVESLAGPDSMVIGIK